MKEIIISPSILSADFANIEQGIREIEKSGAQWVHCDVMDGSFVPNITFGQKMVSDIRKKTHLVLDVHLMIDRPERYVQQFAEAGADIITIHFESTNKVEETLQQIRALGKKAGITIKPNTSVLEIEQFFPLCDMVLVMSVEPGFGGQKFMPSALDKIAFIRTKSPNIVIQCDGGINVDNAKTVVQSGCDSLVMGNAFFGAVDKLALVEQMKKL